MIKTKLIKISLIHSIVASLYVAMVSLLMSNGEKLFGNNNSIFGGIAILLLLVISATIMGWLVLGRPLLMYLDGAKKEALKLFYLTITWLVLIATIIFTSLAIF
ncbi:hypothetical protein COX68_03305 [Candidatus Falkowbacteria bacterium CG_4_10_14_0_2_um_filter_41_15]|uniref:Uncharacterized protein n=2 Tax=Candidatus Falkowiibacteriota TaxID=1752728 RepID=A0A1J4T942_9BACT|nr:MAG: hypothetical protein AUJ35_02920 [Candidatus Falkowbacteria bacterium CG1_02_41_21]PJA09119.1 MAG: hypothetical protein COX68_03305 [Candidatus Falkowbacteria bacterium CG_4_10_14_0_2_um_filter_41_15]